MDQNDAVGISPHGGGAVTTADRGPLADAGAAGIVPSFLSELTRAMQAAAEQQRERIAGVVADEAAGQVDKARKRASVEAEELRRLAEEDVDRIEAWMAEETERIRREASRRTDERRKDLEAHLAQHGSIISAEIDGVGGAVREYRSTLDRFFDELRGATSPADIARRAGSLPEPPDLEGVRGAARASAVARFANAPQEGIDEPATDGPASAVEEAAGPSAGADDGDDWDDAGAGLAVMDPAAVGRSEELPVEPPAEGVAAVSVPRSGAAIRFLRSIAPWTLTEQDEPDRRPQGT